MKYIIKNSDLFLNGKLIPEGTEIELSEVQTKGIESFLIPVSNPEPCPELAAFGEPRFQRVSGSAIISGSESVSESSSELKTNTNNEIKSKSKGNKK